MTTALAPEEQRRIALAKGNRIRLQQAQLKRELSNGGGYGKAADLLLDPSDTVARMRVGKFLTSVRQIGTGRAIIILRRSGMSAAMLERRVGPMPGYRYGITSDPCLTDRQRTALAATLRGLARAQR
jgi:hypothetical protein